RRTPSCPYTLMSSTSARVLELAPAQLATRLASSDAPILIDVRARWEWELARIDNARLMPLDDFARSSASLPFDADIIVHCHHGVRSMFAAQFLVTRGFSRVWNLTGGIDLYAVEGDQRVPRY
ncbi:MAG: rhodanese-like domain-containing protein, partial [Gemmatimonadaceae bacterium]